MAASKVANKVASNKKRAWSKRSFNTLLDFLRQIPSIQMQIGFGTLDDGCWLVKFGIEISHPLAWHIVQELGHVLNYLSMDERLPTVFMPVSPPPYMNGGPEDYLSWVIESKRPDFTPTDCKKWLYGHLPRPVNDISQWEPESDEADV